MGSTANIQVGNIAESAHLPAGTKVTAVNSSSSITVSNNATGTATETLNVSIDFLNTADLFGYSASVNANVYPEIALSQDAVTWGSWQKFAPGAYLARKYKARMQILTNDPATNAVLLSFKFAVDVPDRDDHYNSISLAAAGTTITFKPDGSATNTPFNGGPNGSTTPHIQVTIVGGSGGDDVLLTGVTASQCTIQVVNGGVGVVRTVNVLAQGY
jgi:hypothetical protein